VEPTVITHYLNNQWAPYKAYGWKIPQIRPISCIYSQKYFCDNLKFHVVNLRFLGCDSASLGENIVPIFKRLNIIRLWHFFRTFQLWKMRTRRWFATCGSNYGLIQRRVSEGRVPQLHPFEYLVNSYRLRFCNVRIYTAMSECIRSRKIKKLLLII